MNLSFLHRRWAVGAALACALALGVVVVEAPPRIGHLLATKQGWSEARHRLAAAEMWETELARLGEERGRLEDRFSALTLSRPQGDQASSVLGTLQSAAAASGLTLAALRPLERAREGAYERLPIEVRVRGRFHGVHAFLRAVETSATLMRVREVAVEAADPLTADIEADIVLDVLTLRLQPSSSVQLSPAP